MRTTSLSFILKLLYCIFYNIIEINEKSFNSFLVPFNICSEWVVHPSVRRVKIENPKVNCHIYTYPSHGNENKYEIPADYKTPFSQSDYNVRYAHPTDKQLEIPSQQVSVASSLIDPINK